MFDKTVFFNALIIYVDILLVFDFLSAKFVSQNKQFAHQCEKNINCQYFFLLLMPNEKNVFYPHSKTIGLHLIIFVSLSDDNLGY